VTADLIDQAVVQLRAGATVDDVAPVVLKASCLLTTLRTPQRAVGSRRAAEVPPAIKEAETATYPRMREDQLQASSGRSVPWWC
jgi:hypothetical protein